MMKTAGKLLSATSASFSGIEAAILLGGDAPLTVLGMEVEAGRGAPAHISRSEDKVFVVREGRMTFLVGEETLVTDPGDHLFVPRGMIHSFSAMDGKRASMTLISSPARHDRFFEAMGRLGEPHDPSDVAAICEQYDQRIVGPIVEPEG